MRRQIIILASVAFVAIVDHLLPDVQVDAQVAIAPAIIAAIIGAVSTMEAAQKQQQGQQAAGTAGAAAEKTKGSMTMAPTVKFDSQKATEVNKQAGYNPYTAAGGGTGMDASQLAAIVGGKGPVMGPTVENASKMQAEIEKANVGKNAGAYLSQRKSYSPVATGPESVADSMKSAEAAGAAAKAGGLDYAKAAGQGSGKMSFDEKMQYAAMAASLGSALAGPGAPPPPGAPRGGGMNMSPVFQQMTARSMYGG